MTDTIEPVYTGKYTDSNSVLALFEDISDEPSDALLTVAIDNTEAWIESNLKRHYVPIPTDIPQTLKTIAIYYASSDILMSLYHRSMAGDIFSSDLLAVLCAMLWLRLYYMLKSRDDNQERIVS